MTSILERRRIEAQFAQAMLAEMERHMPRAQAVAILAAAVVRLARAAGREMAGTGPAPDLTDLAAILPRWQQDDALAIDYLERTPERLSFDVTRCRYAEMYREMGLGDLGAVLSCNRDGEFCVGFNPAIALSRTQTLMQGASHCNFRYTLGSIPIKAV